MRNVVDVGHPTLSKSRGSGLVMGTGHSVQSKTSSAEDVTRRHLGNGKPSNLKLHTEPQTIVRESGPLDWGVLRLLGRIRGKVNHPGVEGESPGQNHLEVGDTQHHTCIYISVLEFNGGP